MVIYLGLSDAQPMPWFLLDVNGSDDEREQYTQAGVQSLRSTVPPEGSGTAAAFVCRRADSFSADDGPAVCVDEPGCFGVKPLRSTSDVGLSVCARRARWHCSRNDEQEEREYIVHA